MVPTSRLDRDRRAAKREVDGRNIEDVVVELLARECSVQGSMAAIRERLVRRILLDDSANEGLVPWGPTDEAAHNDARILDWVYRHRPVYSRERRSSSSRRGVRRLRRRARILGHSSDRRTRALEA